MVLRVCLCPHRTVLSTRRLGTCRHPRPLQWRRLLVCRAERRFHPTAKSSHRCATVCTGGADDSGGHTGGDAGNGCSDSLLHKSVCADPADSTCKPDDMRRPETW